MVWVIFYILHKTEFAYTNFSLKNEMQACQIFLHDFNKTKFSINNSTENIVLFENIFELWKYNTYRIPKTRKC